MVRDVTPESRETIDHYLGELDGIIEAGSPTWWSGEDEAMSANLAMARSLGKAV